MLVIAENLNTRNKAYMQVVRNNDKKTIGALAKVLADKVFQG